LTASRGSKLSASRREAHSACANSLPSKSLTRGPGGAALQFEVQLSNLEQLDRVRHRGGPDTSDWMRAFSETLRSPPEVEILRVDEMQPA
jgi:hypothetical protein